jgi:hypothetical protein
MRKLIVAVVVSLLSSPLWAITCPSGEHSQCTGQRYSWHCTCVADKCCYGLQACVAVGGVLYQWTTNNVCLPDTCANYVIAMTCVANGTLSPAPQPYNPAICYENTCGGDDS